MSMGGTFLAITNEHFEKASNNEIYLPDFIHERDNSFSLLSLEQAWDAIRILLIDISPDLFGNEPLEIELGEMSMLVDNKLCYEQISHLSKENLYSLLNNDKYLNADFYWNNVFTQEEEFEYIVDLIVELQQFLLKSINNNQTVLFYIN